MRFSTIFLTTILPAVLANPLIAKRTTTCDGNNIGDTIDDDTWSTLLRVWGESFGSDGGSLAEDTSSNGENCMAVCCSNKCLFAYNKGEGTRSWTQAQFETAVNGLADRRGATQCLFSPLGPQTDYQWTGLEFLNNEYETNIGDGNGYKHMVALFGDTCGGADPYTGPC